MPRPASPQHDGALIVEHPDAGSLFDMGNLSLFATFSGTGDCTRLLLTEGIYLGAWELRIALDGQMLQFSCARAIGRLWELTASVGDVSVVLVCALDEAEPVVVQQCSVSNAGNVPRKVAINLVLNFSTPVSMHRRLKDSLIRTLPRLTRQEHLLGRGWAKSLLPAYPDGVSIADSRTVVVSARNYTAMWRSTSDPRTIERRGRAVEACFHLEVAPAQKLDVAWCLAPDKRNAFASPHDFSNVVAQARHYAAWLSAQFVTGDPLKRSMFVGGLNTALSAYKVFPEDFAGLLAGPEYAYPPRLYFRDGYWTAQILLRFRPEWVRRHILSLSRGVGEDGQCPSGVFAPHLGLSHCDNSGWLPGHIDSPALFMLLLSDYVRATGDLDILGDAAAPFAKPEQQRTVWQAACAALLHLVRQDSDRDGLVEKPYAPNDWADNIHRNSQVTYDQALYTAALRAATQLAELAQEAEWATRFAQEADRALSGMHAALWLPDKSYYANYRRPGFVEDHFSIDTLVVAYYGLVDQERTAALLTAARSLQTRYNAAQPFGDWGVMSVFPPTGARATCLANLPNRITTIMGLTGLTGTASTALRSSVWVTLIGNTC